MNKTKNKHLKVLLACICLVVSMSFLRAQDATALHGSLVVDNEGEVVFDGGSVSFNTVSSGNGFVIGTRRDVSSYISFLGTASPVGASASSFVDGYVRSYKSSAFVFPIGDNGVYRPAAVSSASFITPVSAAYYHTNASLAITSSIFGGTEVALPLGAPFATSSKAESITAIDLSGYWHIAGATAARISLSWIASTGIESFTSSNLANLIIVGWKAGQWVEIPSQVDMTSILGSGSSYAEGSITTNASIVPSDYAVYALGTKVAPKKPGDTLLIVTNGDIKVLGPAAPIDLNTDYSIAGPFHASGTASIDPKTGVISFNPSAIPFVGRDTIFKIRCVTTGIVTVCDTVRVFIEGRPDRSVPISDSALFNTGKVLTDLPSINTGGKPFTTSTSSSAGSTVVVDANGKVNYTPKPGFFGTDTVRVIRCVDGVCDVVTYIIVVKPALESVIPNYFSPNGDGINDIWNLDALLTNYPKTRALIYNRWGNIVWRSTGTYGLSTSGSNVWFGQQEGGKDNVPDGVYYYLLEMEDEFKTSKTGFIEIMRQ